MLLHRFATATATLCFVLLLVGGLVHNTNSGLACGTDWPRCHGTFMPKMEGGVLIEHGHRLTAATVGLLTIVLAAALALRERRKRAAQGGPVALAVAAVFLVIAQGLLGALTVHLGLSAAVSTAHLGTSMLFFALLVVIAWQSRPLERRPSVALPPSARRLAAVTLGLVYAQMLLGAAMRHMGAGLVCGIELPLCHGQLWPAGAHPGVYLHILHRMMGLTILAFAISVGVVVARSTSSRAVKTLALALPALVLVQIVLGIMSMLALLDVAWRTAHLGVAALVLADLVGLLLVTNSARAAESSERRPMPIAAAKRSTGPATVKG